MRIFALMAATSMCLAACGSPDPDSPAAPANGSEPPAVSNGASAAPAETEDEAPGAGWDLQSSGEGVALALLSGTDRTAIRLFCPAARNLLLVNVPGFRPIGSEERLSFGGGGEAVALVADTKGDRQRGGVSGTGEVPADLAAFLRGPVSASYGAQRSGPHTAPPAALARDFAAACRERAAPPAPPAAAGPCRVQDGKPIDAAPLRAVGTEPFWGARIEGRCVTYSHPEDQKGTRVWTRFTPRPGGGTWSGTLGGKPFRLTIRPRKDCSDGMSDKRYPLAADLVVGGERRSGCAEPL